ncbi:BMP family ABC transporter substrate-binding protein [Clostridia bacterium OttesenSCG-928-O13]|nr:BMP family ABC transporter substrate-binding protein [Clostridia bacterium OttesenSCG-928-O13]
MGYVTGVGGLGDNSFNDLGHAGIQMLEADGFETNVIEPSAASEYENVVRSLCQEGDYDLIVAMGSETVDAVTVAQADFPDQKFLVIEAMPALPNTRGVQVDLNDMGFLMGAYAALMEKEGGLEKGEATDTFGIVGGMDFPLIRAITVAYECGVRYINPDYKVLVSFAGSFGDPGKGSELALNMYDQGARVVAQAAGGTGMGVFEAAKDRDLYSVGSDTNQNAIAPDNIIASAARRVDLEIYKAGLSVRDGSFEEGDFLVTLETDPEAINLHYDGSNITPPDSVVKALADMVALRTENAVPLPEENEGIEDYLASVGVYGA